MSCNYKTNELYHHGILGQKWGIRRYQNKDGKLTSIGVRRYKKISEKSRKHTELLGKEQESKNSINRENLIKEHTIPKGTAMYRSTTDNAEKENGHAYVTYLDEDRNMYKGWYANGLRRNKGLDNNAKLYEVKYELTEDLKIPSRKEVQEITEKIRTSANSLKAAKDIADAYIKNFGDRMVKDFINEERYLKWDENHELYLDNDSYNKDVLSFKNNVAKDFINNYRNMKVDELFMRTTEAMGTSDYIRNEIISELRSRGYNAMVDEAGVGGKNGNVREGIEPLIIFDRGQSIRRIDSREISKQEENISTISYADWRRRANQSKDSEW